MKFIHTADLHLDSPLRGLSAYENAPVERLRTATRDAFDNLVGIALEEQVDFMVIAGDIYDGDWKDFNTGLFFVMQMGRLQRAGIPVFMLHGNHDADSEMTRRLQLPDNVQVFSSRKAETFRIEALKVALHGRSFRVAATTDNLVPNYPDPLPGWLNVGVLHTALEGNSDHARYAPCSVAELRARGYHYWALGHVHEHAILSGAHGDPGQPVIAFSGNIQGRHIREPGARGALLVHAEGDRITDVQRIETDVLRWHRLEVALTGDDDFPSALRACGHALDALLQDTPAALPLAVRVVFRGQTAADARLRAEGTQLRHEVIAQALALDPDRLWIEKVRVDTQAPAAGTRHDDEALQGTLAQLQDIARSAIDDEAFIQSLLRDWQPLLGKLPADVRAASDDLRALIEEPEKQMPARLHEAMLLLTSRLAATPHTGH